MLACRCLLEGDHSSTSLLLLVALDEVLLKLVSEASELLLLALWPVDAWLNLVFGSFLHTDALPRLVLVCVTLS